MADELGSDAITDDLTRAQYASFIGQIELREIWLRSSQIENTHGPSTPERISITVDSLATCEELPEGFRVLHAYTVSATSDEQQPLNLEATFALDFDSKQPMTDAIFSVFAEVNIPVNSWPFLREYVATTVGRMGWQAITLPALKRGASAPTADYPSDPAKPEQQQPKKGRSRQSRKKSAE